MFDTTGWIVAGIAVLLTGLSKSGFGGALGGLAVPFMAIWLSPADAAAVMLPILCLMDVIGIRAFWGKWSKPELKLLIPSALVGIAVGSIAFGVLSDKAVKACVGLIAILFSLDRMLGLRNRLKLPEGASLLSGGFWGAMSGFTSTLAHAGGPPVLVYLLGRKLDKGTFVATTVIFFTIINAAKLIPYLALGIFSVHTLQVTLLLSPLAPVGVLAGMRLQHMIPERPFFFFSTALLGISGLKLFYDGVF